MKLKFLKAKYGIDFKIPKKTKEKLNEIFPNSKNNKKTLAVFCAVQFRDNLDFVIEYVENLGYNTKISKAARVALSGQILGCDSYKDSLNLDLSEIDGFIYIGDGYFHPNALLLAQENEDQIKPVIVVNVVQQIVDVIGREHIEAYLKKRKGNLLKFHTSKDIGVFVTYKWGQEYKDAALKLKEKFKDKNFYFFVADNFNELEMENFPWVECWVNTACPRIGQDDILRHKRAVINIKDIW